MTRAAAPLLVALLASSGPQLAEGTSPWVLGATTEETCNEVCANRAGVLSCTSLAWPTDMNVLSEVSKTMGSPCQTFNHQSMLTGQPHSPWKDATSTLCVYYSAGSCSAPKTGANQQLICPCSNSLAGNARTCTHQCELSPMNYNAFEISNGAERLKDLAVSKLVADQVKPSDISTNVSPLPNGWGVKAQICVNNPPSSINVQDDIHNHLFGHGCCHLCTYFCEGPAASSGGFFFYEASRRLASGGASYCTNCQAACSVTPSALKTTMIQRFERFVGFPSASWFSVSSAGLVTAALASSVALLGVVHRFRRGAAGAAPAGQQAIPLVQAATQEEVLSPSTSLWHD